MLALAQLTPAASVMDCGMRVRRQRAEGTQPQPRGAPAWLVRRGCAIGALLLLGFVPPAQAQEAPTIAAAGDIACGPSNSGYNDGHGTAVSCQQLQTSNLLAGRQLSAVLPLGDLQYDESSSLESYLAAYEPTWGRWKVISRPAIGNHEYDD